MKPKLWVAYFWALLLLALPAHATFHLMEVEKVIAGVAGDPTAQAIQLVMREDDQDLVTHARLVAYDANGTHPIVLIHFPFNVVHSSSNARILITSQSFKKYTETKCKPDFILTNLIPQSYFAAGRITYETVAIPHTVLWSFAWGGSNYKGSTTGAPTNSGNNGEFGPPVSGPLPKDALFAWTDIRVPSDAAGPNSSDYQLDNDQSIFTNNAGTEFQIARPIGDVNGDGHPDIVMYSATSGSTQLFAMSGTAVLGTENGPVFSSTYSALTVGQFDAPNGESQILLLDSSNNIDLAYLGQHGNLEAIVTGPAMPAGFHFVAARDVSGDRRLDAILYNPATRSVRVMVLNASYPTLSGTLVKGPKLSIGNNWTVATAADVNKDGFQDLVLFNPVTRALAVWFLNESSVVGFVNYGPVVPRDFSIVGAADYNGDTRPDLLLYNSGTGATKFLYLHAGGVTGSADGPSIPTGFTPLAP